MSSGALKLLARHRLRALRRAREACRSAAPRRAAAPRWVGLEPLEQRLLYSVAPPGSEILAGQDQLGDAEVVLDGPERESDTTSDTTRDGQDETAEWRPRRELVFIDTRVPDYQSLLGELLADSGDGRRIEVVILDGERDGVTQISETLERYEGLDAVHVISHGTDAGVQLGGSWLTLGNLAEQSEEISGWGESLSANADLLLYGCDLAASADGRSLVDQLSGLTGADVAASADLTGAAQLGGDWDLEYHAGEIEAASALDAGSSWQGVLTAERWYLDGAGDGSDVPAAALKTSAPIDPTLDNFDPGRDAVDGLIIAKGGTGVDDVNPQKHQVWTIAAEGAELDGSATLTLWTAMKDFDTIQAGSITAYLVECDPGGANCTEIASDTITRPDWDTANTGTWIEDTFDFGAVSHTVGAGKELGIKLIVNGADDMLVAYDSVTYPSRLEIGAPDSGDLWLTTVDAGDAGGETWVDTEIVRFGDDGDVFDTGGTTSGTFEKLTGFAAPYDVRAMHYVSSTVTIGTTGTKFTLEPGDLILTLDPGKNTTGDAGGLAVDRQDIVVFRPDTAGDYSSGTYSMLFDGGVHDGGASTYNVHAISLVEKDTTVGGTVLEKGTFLVAHSDPSEHNSIYTFTATGTGVGASTQTSPHAPLLLGTPLGTSDQIQGLHLVQSDIDLGGTVHSAGTLLVTVKGANTYAGQAQTAYDVVALSVTQTEQDATPGTAATATLLFDGSDIQLDANGEEINGLTIVATGVTNVAPTVTTTSSTLAYTENDPATAIDPGLTLADADDIDIENATVTISSGYVSGEDVLAFVDLLGISGSWNADDGVLTLSGSASVADYQTALRTVTYRNVAAEPDTTSRQVTFEVDDGDDTGSDVRTISITDTNDTAPVVTASQAFNVSESAADSTSVGTVLATDADTVGSLQSWTIVSGNGAGIFQINASTGEITIADNTSLDYETATSHVLGVQVGDGVQTSATENVTINVTDTNDTAPVVTASQAFNVSESAANTTSVGTVLATDADTVGSLQGWTIVSGNGAGIFQINASTGEITIADNTGLDYETTSSYVLGLQVGDGITSSATETVTINVTDANDNTPVVTAAQAFNVSEAAGDGTSVGTVLATDSDTVGSLQGWAIVSGNGAGIFQINASTGEITIADSTGLDRESAAGHALGVQVGDGVSTSATETVTVNVTDVNDTVPVIPADQTLSVFELAANGTSVGTVAAQDPDTTGSLQAWTIVSGDPGGVFQINAATGEITVADNSGLDYETTSSYALGIRVGDGVASSATQTVTVNVSSASTPKLWVTTLDDVAASGAPGLDSWTGGEILLFDDPALTFDTAGTPADTTAGTFSRVFNIDDFVVGNDTQVTDFHYVNTSVTVGSGANSFALQEGDVIFSTYDPETLQSTNTLAVSHIDVVVFRPDAPGDYSAGTFTMLLDGAMIPERSGGLHGISLVEYDTTVGDTLLSAGTFLLADSISSDVIHYTADGVGAGTTSGTWSTLIDGGDINMSQFIRGIELIESQTEIGGTTLEAGAILLTVNFDDATVGDNAIAVSRADIFKLAVTKTDWDQATTVADAAIFLDGSDVGLDTSEERMNGFSLVTGGNDVAPTIGVSQAFNVAENAADGTSVGSVTATDPDLVGVLQDWTIVSGNGDGIFQIDASTGEITIADNTSLDRESAASHVLGIQVGDGVGTSATETVTVTVTDVNDSDPVITAAQSFNVSEAVSNGAAVGTVAATDADTTGSLQAWTITSGNASGIFQINAATGEITIADRTGLDYEAAASHVLGVQVGDGVQTSATENVTINITDVNDTAPVVTASQAFNVSESAADSTSVGTVVATDADTVGSLQSWTIVSGNGAGIFQINAATGEITIADNTALDYETATSHVLGVRVGDGVQTSATENVTINITDVNDTAPVVTASQAFNVSESAADSTSVGTVLATDADTVGSLQSWTIVSGNGAGIFQINASTGEITIADSTGLDYETATSHVLGVQVGDGITSSATENVTINVTDANDMAPVVTASQAFNVSESAADSTSVGTVLATDTDTVGSLQSWSIVSGNGAGIFQINASTGEITIADNTSLDYETQASHVLGIQVGDGVSTSATENVTINVTDANDTAPAVSAGLTFALSANAADGTSVGTVTATDPDTVGSLRDWAIVSGNGDGVFQIDASTAEIAVADRTNIDYDTTPTYVLGIQVADGANASAVETVTIGVTSGPTGVVADVSVTEDAANTVIDLFAAFSDAEDADADLLYSLIGNTNPGLFSSVIVDGAAGRLTLDHAPDQHGAASLTLRVRDTEGNFVDEAFTVTVDPANDDPVLVTNAGATVVQSGSVVVTGAMLRVTDIDDTSAELVYTITAAPGHGTLQLNGQAIGIGDTFTQQDVDGGRLTYVHDGTSVVDGFGFTVHDASGAGLSGQTFDVTAAGPVLAAVAPTAPAEKIETVSPDNTETEADTEDETEDSADDEELSEAEVAALTDEDGAAIVENPAQPRQATLEQPAPEAIILIDQGGAAAEQADEDDDQRTGDRPQVSTQEVDVAAAVTRVERPQADLLGAVKTAFARISSVDRPGVLWNELDGLTEQMTAAPRYEIYAAGSATLVVTGLSAGYLVAMIRGGYLMASVLSSMPAWQMVDPLPILDGLDGVGLDGDGESLASIIDDAQA